MSVTEQRCLILQVDKGSSSHPRDSRGAALQRQGGSPARHRSGSSNLVTAPRQPSSSLVARQLSSSGLQRQPSNSSGLSRQASLAALLRQGSSSSPSPAPQRRSGQSPALQRAGAGSGAALLSPPAAASSGAQRQSCEAILAGTGISKGALAALLRQASPGMQRPEGVISRQGGRYSVPRRRGSPELGRPEASGGSNLHREGSRGRAVRGSSPALHRIGSLPSPVVAADFGGKSSAVLATFPSADLTGQSERVSTFIHTS